VGGLANGWSSESAASPSGSAAVASGSALAQSADASRARTALAQLAGAPRARTALIVDAALARDGRELIDPRLRALDAEIRIPRTVAEAETDLRYFAAQGYRLVVAGPDSQAAAKAAGLAATGAAPSR